MRIKVMFAVLAFVIGLFGTAMADNVSDNFIGFGTLENCSYGASIDGNYAAVIDDWGDYALYLYDFRTKTLQPVDTRTDIRVYGASISGTKIAYLYSVGWSGGKNIAIYDRVTGEITETGITTADGWDSHIPMRFFDGERITFTEGGSAIKYYTLSTGQVTDTGLVGWDPIIDGDIIAFSARRGTYGYDAAMYNIQTGETTIFEPGYGTVVAGNVVAYIASDNDEVKYYLLHSGTIHATGLTDIEVMSTDGRRIAVSPNVGSIKLFDVISGKIEDTGEWPCTGEGGSCWIEIEGEYIAYERWEGGADYRTSEGTNVEIYPPQDYNGDGLVDGACAGGWFVSPVADNVVFENFTGFGTFDNCSYGASIDGDYAAVIDDSGEYPLYLYHFPTGTLQPVDTRTDIRVFGASLSGTKIAYLYSAGWSGGKNIAIYDRDTGEITETGITTADRWDSYRPMRFFDGERIAFTEGYGSTIKYYTLSTGLVTDTGLDGWDPIIDGDIIAFNGYDAAIYNIQTGETTIFEYGYDPVVAGNVVAYIASDNDEVKYYLLHSGTIHSTGLTNTQVISTDGRRIAVVPEMGSIKLFDVATGKYEDTGEWPCTGQGTCWIEIDGEYIAYERWESGADYRTSQGTNLEIYPPQDYNGDGLAESVCVGGWFVSPLEPRANLQATINSITPDPDSEPIFYADEVTFSGSTGEDIIGHAWYSDLDGFLGDEPTLTTSSLSIGTHIITYEIENFERYISTSSPRAVTVNSQAERVDLALEWGDISFWQDGVEVTYPSVDSPVTVKAVIHNLSTGRASSPGTVSFRDIYAVNTYRNNYLGDQILPEIPENGSASVEFTWTPDPNDPMPGYHLIEVSVAQDQYETYTSNNTASHHLVRGSGEAEGNISVHIENLNVSDLQQFYVGDRPTVSGRAYYRWDESGHTYPVLGGQLTIRLYGQVYETRTTDSGYFYQQVVIPLEEGFYPLSIEVSDASVVGKEQPTIEAIPYPYVGPDLTIHNIRLANGVAGMPETVHAYVVNRGGDVAAGPFDNNIEIFAPSGESVFTSTETFDNTNGLCSGCGVTLTFTGWTPSISGYYQVTVTTDFSDSINESNENNNRVTSTFYVYPYDVDLEIAEIIKSCGSVSALVVNWGGLNSSGGLLHFSDSAGTYYTAQIPVIGGKGGSTWISATPYSGSQPGTQITACIESSEDPVPGNNCRSGIFDFTNTSDLTVTNLRMNYQSWWGANTAYISMPNTLWAEVRNLGCMAAGGTLDFEVDGITVGNVTLPEITGGGATVVSTTFDFLGYVAGTDYTLKGTVNVADTAPGNNSRSEALTVSPQLPDYRVVSEDITFDPEHPEKNEPTVITADIHNVGLAEGNEFSVAFYEDGYTLIGEIQTYSIYPGILPGDLLQVSPRDENGNLVLWQSGAPGKHTIMVTVAPLAGVENDPNDADNSATRKVIVNNDPYADVVVTGTSDTAGKDDTVTFSAAGSNDDLDLDGLGGIIRYEWDFGDGQTLYDGGVEVTHQYLEGGNYYATVTVIDTNGAIASSLVSVTVPNNVIGAAGPNGSISPSGSLFVNPGGVQTFTITPDIGYQILSVDGCGGTLTGNSYETGVINADCTVSATFVDNQPPTITATVSPTANAAGWHNSDVTATFICDDVESGIAECTPPVTITTEGEGQPFTGTAVDNAGNTASTTIVLDIDKTPPVIVISGVQEGGIYTLGLAPQADFTVTDAISGLTSSNESLTGGDGLGLGTFAYSVTAADLAGNSNTLTIIYDVVASVQGLDAQVQQYVDSGDIDPALQSDLIDALADAQQDIDAGDPDKADQDLDRFKGDVDRARDRGEITTEAAAVIINAVNYVILNN